MFNVFHQNIESFAVVFQNCKAFKDLQEFARPISSSGIRSDNSLFL